MRSLCCYPMGKHMVANFCQKAPSGSASADAAQPAATGAAAEPAGGVSLCTTQGARLRIAGVRPGDGYSGASRKGGVHRWAKTLGLLCTPQPMSRKSRRLIQPVDCEEAGVYLLEKEGRRPARMTLPG